VELLRIVGRSLDVVGELVMRIGLSVAVEMSRRMGPWPAKIWSSAMQSSWSHHGVIPWSFSWRTLSGSWVASDVRSFPYAATEGIRIKVATRN
jgi:hypothetical protein